MMEKKYRVLLYYQFVNIEDPEMFSKEHLALCKSLNLKGRILVAKEGLNGTLSGSIEETEKYMEILHGDERFKDMIFKMDYEDEHAFKKIFVRPKNSIITLLEDDDVDPISLTGTHLKPEDFHEMLQRDDVIVVDGRNDYEYELGHFRNAIRPDIKNFKQFPEWIDKELSEHKDKKILTYCTGGIRCEKLTGVLMNKGFNDVYQLDGGIVTYGKDPKVQGKLFDGKCYVFDERIAVRINNTEEDIIISKCHHCGNPSDRYINCYNDDCHSHYICCESCEKEHEGFCSDECKEYVINKPERNAHLRLQRKAEEA